MNLCIIQARNGSTRLKNKAMLDLCGHPILWHVIERVKRSKLIDYIVVATTQNYEDVCIRGIANECCVEFFAGNELDVLDRFYQCAKYYEPDNIVRVTGDCPLIDHEIIDNVIEKHIKDGNDYTSNAITGTYPDGLDVSVMKYSVLVESFDLAVLKSEREHVVLYVLNRPDRYNIEEMKNNIFLGNERWTLDYQNDYKFIRCIYEALYPIGKDFNMNHILSYLNSKPELRLINRHERDEGLKKSLEFDKC